jgi:hypothetical protein
MTDKEYLDAQLEMLKRNPTVSAWEAEIRRVLLGQRESALTQGTSAVEYLEALQKQSGDEALARTSFNEALRNVVQSWQPSRSESTAYVTSLLDLIGVYTPPAGFIKVLGFVNRHRNIIGDVPTPDERASGEDLYLRALTVLQNYYPTASVAEDDNAGFRQYVDTLRAHLHEPRYYEYALQRLYELYLINPTDADVVRAAEANPAVVARLISLIIKSDSLNRMAEELSLTYGLCLKIDGGAEVFEQSLAEIGSRLEHSDEGPQVRLAGDKRVTLTVPEEVEAAYILIRWSVGSERGLNNLNEVSPPGSDER